MSESLLDDALSYCRGALRSLPDTTERAQFCTRLSILERAAWSLSLTRPDEVVRLAKIVLELREEIVCELRVDRTGAGRGIRARAF